MRKKTNKSWRPGVFTLSDERKISGQLKLDGANTLVHLFDRDFIDFRSLEQQSINCALYDLTKVSLIGLKHTAG
jgi:hypothetical protein